MVGLVSSAMAPPAPAAVAPSSPVAAAAPGPTANPPVLKNPLLAQIEQGIEAKIKPESSGMYHSIVVASMKLAFDATTHASLVKGLQSSPDIIKNVSLVCAGIIGTVFHESKQDINKFLPAAVPAALTLMCQILDYAEQSKLVQLTPDNVAQCSTSTGSAVLRKFGIDKNQVNQAVAAGKNPPASAAPTSAGV